MKNKNRHFNTFIDKVTPKDKNEPKICISRFPSEILFDLIHYVRNHWEGGYKGVLFVKEGIRLHHRVFTNSIDAQNCIFEEQMEFDNCIFEEQTEFDKSSFLSDISFKRSIFRGSDFKSISFREVTFGGDEIDFCLTEFYSGDFSKAVFKENSFIVDFKGAKLYNVTFNEAQFKRTVSFEKLENPTEIKSTKFERAIFSKQANFHNVLFYDDISFQNAIFTGKTYFFNITSKKISEDTTNGKEKEFTFKGAKFQNETYFSGNNYIELNFSEGEFGVKDEDITISFSNAKFYENIRFHHCDFYSSINFENTTFEKLVDFYLAIFHNEQQFLRTDFFGTCIFSGVTFEKEVQFLYNKVKSDSYLNFESSIFSRCIDISRANFRCTINFWNIKIEGIENIQTYQKYIDDFGKYPRDKKNITPTTYSKIRETFRIIKSNFYMENNKIEGLNMYKNEMSVYQREQFSLLGYNRLDKILYIIRQNIKIKYIFFSVFFIFFGYFNLKMILNNESKFFIIYILFFALPISFILLFYIKDIILLLLNRISNKFGTDWIRGVSFIVIMGVITSYILLKKSYNFWSFEPYNLKAWEESVAFFLNVINIVDMKPFDNGVKSANGLIQLVQDNDFNNIILFIGRIFIGYGYYQTIQAFRKFGKS
ncbi:pentapeptide repeat-containing protein [Capnocytophaga sputigena]|jgi:putative membrane protein|uniref:pentapeptide repeat-containing protein n=1 Tax=Capnocytophaga sputigena TaxID=1019 RepID=UPI0028EB2201|nr:pentapeptide repeat-containing protein [Capnocytophaga sputigena]